MPVPERLYNLVKADYEAGDSPENIVEKLATTKNYPYIANKTKQFLEEGKSSHEILNTFAQAEIETPGGWIETIAKTVPRAVYRILQGIPEVTSITGKIEETVLTPLFGEKFAKSFGQSEFSDDLVNFFTEVRKSWTPITDPADKSINAQLKEMAGSGVESAAQMGLDILLTGGRNTAVAVGETTTTVATQLMKEFKESAGALKLMGAQAGFAKAHEIITERDKNNNIVNPFWKGIVGGTAAGISEMIFEFGPLDIITSPMKSFTKRLTSFALADLPGELATTATEMKLIDEMFLGKKYTQEQWIKNLVFTAGATLFGSGATTMLTHPFFKEGLTEKEIKDVQFKEYALQEKIEQKQAELDIIEKEKGERAYKIKRQELMSELNAYRNELMEVKAKTSSLISDELIKETKPDTSEKRQAFIDFVMPWDLEETLKNKAKDWQNKIDQGIDPRFPDLIFPDIDKADTPLAKGMKQNIEIDNESVKPSYQMRYAKIEDLVLQAKALAGEKARNDWFIEKVSKEESIAKAEQAQQVVDITKKEEIKEGGTYTEFLSSQLENLKTESKKVNNILNVYNKEFQKRASENKAGDKWIDFMGRELDNTYLLTWQAMEDSVSLKNEIKAQEVEAQKLQRDNIVEKTNEPVETGVHPVNIPKHQMSESELNAYRKELMKAKQKKIQEAKAKTSSIISDESQLVKLKNDVEVFLYTHNQEITPEQVQNIIKNGLKGKNIQEAKQWFIDIKKNLTKTKQVNIEESETPLQGERTDEDTGYESIEGTGIEEGAVDEWIEKHSAPPIIKEGSLASNQEFIDKIHDRKALDVFNLTKHPISTIVNNPRISYLLEDTKFVVMDTVYVTDKQGKKHKVPASFDPTHNVIEVSADASISAIKNYLIPHEVMHALTYNKLKVSKEFRDSINNLIDDIYQQLDVMDAGMVDKIRKGSISDIKAAGINTSKFYGMRNEFEFVAEAFTNKIFEEFLAETKVTHPTKGVISAFKSFIDKIKHHVMRNKVKENALEEVVKITEKYMMEDSSVHEVNTSKDIFSAIFYHGTKPDFFNIKDTLIPQSLDDIMNKALDDVGVKNKENIKNNIYKEHKKRGDYFGLFDNETSLYDKAIFLEKDLEMAKDYAEWAGEGYENALIAIKEFAPEYSNTVNNLIKKLKESVPQVAEIDVEEKDIDEIQRYKKEVKVLRWIKASNDILPAIKDAFKDIKDYHDYFKEAQKSDDPIIQKSNTIQKYKFSNAIINALQWAVPPSYLFRDESSRKVFEGARTYTTNIENWVREWIHKKYYRILNEMPKDVKENIGQWLETESDDVPPSIKKLRDLLIDVHSFVKENGYDIGNISYYFPHMYDNWQITYEVGTDKDNKIITQTKNVKNFGTVIKNIRDAEQKKLKIIDVTPRINENIAIGLGDRTMFDKAKKAELAFTLNMDDIKFVASFGDFKTVPESVFMANFLKRKMDNESYRKDAINVLDMYMYGVARKVYGDQFIKVAGDAIKNTTEPRLQQIMKDYTRDVLGKERSVVDLAVNGLVNFVSQKAFGKEVELRDTMNYTRNLALTQYIQDLGGMVSSSIANASQLFLNVGAVVDNITFLKGMNESRKVFIDLAQEYINSKQEGRDSKYENIKGYNELVESGVLAEAPIGIEGTTTNTMLRVPLLLFQGIERFNRVTTYMIGKEFANTNPEKMKNALRILGVPESASIFKEGATAEMLASELVDYTQYRAERFNTPEIFKSPAMKLLAPYKTFLINQTALQLSLVKHMIADKGLKGQSALASTKFITIALMLGGSAATPLAAMMFSIFDNLWKELFGLSIKDEKIGDLEIGHILEKGIPASFGVDISGSIAMQYPTKLSEVVGRYANAAYNITQEKWEDALHNLTPRIIEKGKQSVDVYNYGQYRNYKGHLITEVDPSFIQASKVLAGFAPSKAIDYYRKIGEEKEIKQWRETKVDVPINKIAQLISDISNYEKKGQTQKVKETELAIERLYQGLQTIGENLSQRIEKMPEGSAKDKEIAKLITLSNRLNKGVDKAVERFVIPAPIRDVKGDVVMQILLKELLSDTQEE